MATNGTTSVNGGVFLTVDANTVWNGHLTLSGSLVTGAGIVAAANATPSITLSGAGGNYANGTTVTKIQLSTPAQVLGALSGSTSTDSVTIGPITVQARENVVTLVLNTGGATNAQATSIGE